MDLILKPRTLTVLCAPHAGRDEAALLAAELALSGPVTVLDGGNRFAAFRLMQHLRLHLPDPAPAARRVFVRRAFTCYQMQALLDAAPSRPQPHILLDLLATFYDENVPLPEARHLLESCLRQVERLSQAGSLLVTLSPPPSPGRAFFVEEVCALAGNLYTTEPSILPTLQPALF
jgi:hypothetical protein